LQGRLSRDLSGKILTRRRSASVEGVTVNPFPDTFALPVGPWNALQACFDKNQADEGDCIGPTAVAKILQA